MLAGSDIGYGGREDIRSFLIQQTRSLSLLFGLFIDLLGYGPFFNLSFDDPLADVHPQVIDGSCFREREDVDALKPVAFSGARIRKFLTDRRAGDGAGDGNVHVGLENGSRGESTGLVRAEQQGPFRDLVDAHGGNDSGTQRDRRFGRAGVRGRSSHPRGGECHADHQDACTSV